MVSSILAVTVLPLRLSSILLLLIVSYCILLFQSFYVVWEKLNGYCYLVLETGFLEQLFLQHINSAAQSTVDSLQSLWGCAGSGLARVNFLHNSCYILDRAVFRAVLLNTASQGQAVCLSRSLPSESTQYCRRKRWDTARIADPKRPKGYSIRYGIKIHIQRVGKEEEGVQNDGICLPK